MNVLYIVLIVIFIVASLFILLLWLRRRQTQTTLSGGGIESTTVTNNQGVNSYCTVDGDKFIKYYFEFNDERLYTTPIWYVVDKSKFTCKRLNELDMLVYVSKCISPNPCPKVYVEESCNIDFDENIFNAIRSHVWYDKDSVQIKRLVTDYIKGVTLQQYLINNGLKVNSEKRTIEGNDVPKNIMVTAYRTWFELVLRFIDEDIIPDDLDNMSNLIVRDSNEFSLVALDCSFWLIVCDRPTHVLNEDLLYNYFWNLYWRHRRKSLDIIFALKAHKHWREILKESLDGLIPRSMYERILEDFVSKPHEYVRMKQQILMQLCGDNSMRSVDTYDLFNLFVSDKQKYDEVISLANDIVEQLPYNITETFDIKQLHASWDFVYNKHLTSAEQAAVFLQAKQYSGNLPDKMLSNVRYLIESIEMTNDTLTLYPLNESVCFFTAKNNGNKPITTSKYLPLIKSNNGCTVTSTYIGDTEICDKYFYDGFFVTQVNPKETLYVVLDDI